MSTEIANESLPDIFLDMFLRHVKLKMRVVSAQTDK